jgi:hypothetical protein
VIVSLRKFLPEFSHCGCAGRIWWFGVKSVIFSSEKSELTKKVRRVKFIVILFVKLLLIIILIFIKPDAVPFSPKLFQLNFLSSSHCLSSPHSSIHCKLIHLCDSCDHFSSHPFSYPSFPLSTSSIIHYELPQLNTFDLVSPSHLNLFNSCTPLFNHIFKFNLA